jgi:3-ketosteroid 9alpha-monooxygenase subunit B
MSAEVHLLKVAGIVQETPDARSILLAIPPELRTQFRYRAGQFLTFEIPWTGFSIRRSYSLASAPESDPWPKVTVKRVTDGRASNWFNDAVKVGDTLKVQAPEGRFVLKEGEKDRPLTLFGGGSGITPVLSLLKSALITTPREILLVYANRDECSIIFNDELALLTRMFPKRLRVHHHLDVAKGFLDVDAVKKLASERVGSDFYICGPGPFMDTVEAALEALQVKHADRFIERFNSPVDPDRRVAAAEPQVIAGTVPVSFSLKMDGKVHTVPYKQGQTLLQAATAAGVSAPSSCEDGYCGCCMAFLRSGKVHMSSHEALTPADIKKGWILPCQAKAIAAEPLSIDLDEKY